MLRSDGLGGDFVGCSGLSLSDWNVWFSNHCLIFNCFYWGWDFWSFIQRYEEFWFVEKTFAFSIKRLVPTDLWNLKKIFLRDCISNILSIAYFSCSGGLPTVVPCDFDAVIWWCECDITTVTQSLRQNALSIVLKIRVWTLQYSFLQQFDNKC